MTAILYLNLALALLGSFAAFGALNKTQWGVTRPCISAALVLIAVGLCGSWLGLVREQWAYYADTALYGGVLAMIIASQRRSTWFLERWANPVASVIAVVAGAVFLVGVLSGCAGAPPYERYLSEEADAQMREACERPGGCTVVPGLEWQAIRAFLAQHGIELPE